MTFFNSIYWMTFLLFFAMFAKSFWLYVYSALYLFNDKRRFEEFTGKVGIVVPVFNEDEDKLIDTINSLKVAHVSKVVFVNDGSTNNVSKVLKEHNWGYKVINLKKNMGKRCAQKQGLEYLDKDTEIVVFMDGDTCIEPTSIPELVRPFTDSSIGATTACILIRNRANFLTKCISAMYWTASNIWRKAPSNLGYLQVTNGQLSAYRYKLVMDLLPKYLTQTFMGVKCTLSDDRWLTHHIQTDFDKKIYYADKSIAYTYVPETYRTAYRMFLRWRLGSLRESLLLLKRFWRKPVLVADVWANHLIALMQTIVRIGIIIMAFTYPLIILYYFGIIIVISLLFAFHMMVKNFREIGYRVMYSLLNEIMFGWVFVHAIFTIRRQGTWQTR